MDRARGLLVVLLALLTLPASASAEGVTNSGDDARTGYYPGQPSSLERSSVLSSSFGQLFATQLQGQVYAQPLVSNGVLLAVTENNRVYGLDPVTGDIKWQRQVGVTFDPQAAPIQCPDLKPEVGITATPVIDPAGGGTAYFTSKLGASDPLQDGQWVMHAIDLQTGNEKTGFPVPLEGDAQNVPGVTFNGKFQLQRPGLLLMDGVVYAAFAGHCDVGDYRGWVMGVSTSGELRARWASEPAESRGAGIWQTGTGIASDRPGRMFVVTGNAFDDGTPFEPTPGKPAPPNLGQAIVSLEVQPGGALKATDFFAPEDAQVLDVDDGDFGSGGPVVLPRSFGTGAYPDLVSVAGKEGTLYTFDRNDLGGFRQGPDGGNGNVDEAPQAGAVFGKPAANPGGGGWLYVATDLDAGQGIDFYRRSVAAGDRPRFRVCARTAGSEAVGIGTSSPIVTSTAPPGSPDEGSTLMWSVVMANRSGAGAELRVYDPEPACDTEPEALRGWAVGTGTKYNAPGVADGRLYVGTLDGRLLGFGSPTEVDVQATGTGFGRDAIVGQTKTQTVTVTALRDGVKLKRLGTDPGDEFDSGNPSPGYDSVLDKGDTFTAPVTFTPKAPGARGAVLFVGTQVGGQDRETLFALSGRATADGGYLQSYPAKLSLGAIAVGKTGAGAATLENEGSKPLTITGVTLPPAPAQVEGLPATPFTMTPGQRIELDVRLKSDDPLTYGGTLAFTTDGVEPSAEREIGITGVVAQPAKVVLDPPVVSFPATPVGFAISRKIAVRNDGGAPVRLSKVKPPSGDAFTVDVPGLVEGATLPAGEALTGTATFTPTADGDQSGTFVLTATDGVGARKWTFTGTGGTPPPPPPRTTETTTVVTVTTAAPPPAPAVDQPPVDQTPAVAQPVSALGTLPAALAKLTLTGNARPVLHFVASKATAVTLSVRRRGAKTALFSQSATVKKGAVKMQVSRRLARGRYTLLLTPRGGIPTARYVTVR